MATEPIAALKGLATGLLRLVSGLLDSHLPVATAPAAAALKGLATGLLRLVDGLLDPHFERAADLGDWVSNLASGLLRLVDGLLGLLGGGGGGETPSPADTPSSPAALLESLATGLLRLVEGLQHSFSEQIGHLAAQLYGFLIGGGSPTPPDPAGTEGVPVPGQPPPPAPPGNTPVGISSVGSGSSFGGGGTSSLLLLGVLASLPILSRGGTFSWPSRESLRPNSAPLLAIERPG
jgi:hypothetical protein